MSELRRDPVTGRLVVIAPERLLAREAFMRPAPVGAIGGDLCPFCEGQERAAGRELLAWRPAGSPPDGPGWQLRVVVNREPALRVESPLGEPADALFQAFGGLGAHEVVIESAEHGATLASMSADEVRRVLWAWRERMRDLKRDTRLQSVLVVKNVGGRAGATLDHAHSQLLALPLVPDHLSLELSGARAYHERTARCVFCEIAEQELAADLRVVGSDAETIALAPFASRVPFEVWLLPRAHQAAFEDVPDPALAAMAARLRDVMARLDRVLVAPPYTLLVHSAPLRPDASPRSEQSFHWHVEIVPRLLPVAGLAWDGGVHINPVTPEEAAEVLRDIGVR